MDEERSTTQPLQSAQPPERQTAQQEPPQPQTEASLAAMRAAESPTQSKIAIGLIGGLLALFLLVGGFFLYQQSQFKTPISATPPPARVVPFTPTPVTKTTEELAVPTVSENTSLDELEKEINQTQPSSPRTDLEELESEASRL